MRTCPKCDSTHYETNEGVVIFRTYENGRMLSCYHRVDTELHVTCLRCGHEFNPYEESDWGRRED